MLKFYSFFFSFYSFLGEKPYVCSVAGCNKRFTEYSSLYKHHVVHTHSKPYICNVCGKTYRQTSTLAMHKRTSHGIVDSTETDAVNNIEIVMTGKSWENISYIYLIFLLTFQVYH